MDRAEAVRVAGLWLPLAATAAAAAVRRPGKREAAGAFLATAWAFPALLALHLLADAAGWWRFGAEGLLLAGIPFDLLLGWSLLWGALPALALPRAPLWVVGLLALWIDLLLMPLCAPVVVLAPGWLAGEAVGIAGVLVPALLLGRWTAEDRRVGWRAALQAGAAGGLTLLVLPAAAFAAVGWNGVPQRPAWAHSLLLQVLAVPALLGVAAVQEFAVRGEGTPVPFDPPRRLVTTGVYRYVANPMQTAAALTLLGWGLFLGSAHVSAAGAMAVVYGMGIAAWDEGADLGERFGEPWREYRAGVRPWLPRWRPWHAADAAPARLWVAAGCGPCSQVGRWVERRRPVGLVVVPAEAHPGGDLDRVTYDPADGSAEEDGVAALGRALEHLGLGWALLGAAMRLPVLRPVLQLLVDVSGGEPRRVARWTEAEAPRG